MFQTENQFHGEPSRGSDQSQDQIGGSPYRPNVKARRGGGYGLGLILWDFCPSGCTISKVGRFGQWGWKQTKGAGEVYGVECKALTDILEHVRSSSIEEFMTDHKSKSRMREKVTGLEIDISSLVCASWR